ncbi:hypothetical protein LTR10_000301 [Elasticomyces elasticus]|nr:hypothetical protein LTR10_000301 [Elasticomyces elasticus]KAK4980444.1 hypothetical protein LTR42_000751 [Elasticomyces elasticus]
MDSGVGNKCHLLALPPELRNRVYECVFEDEAPRNIHVGDIDNHWPSAALPASCQQICKETLEMLRAAVLQFKNNHVCIIDTDPLIRHEENRIMLLERFGGTGYSSAKLSSLEIRTGNAAVQTTRTIMANGVLVPRPTTHTGSAVNPRPDTLQMQARDVGIMSIMICNMLPQLTAHRWREHCHDLGISQGHVDYKDPRTWDMKDIIRQTHIYCSSKAAQGLNLNTS